MRIQNACIALFMLLSLCQGATAKELEPEYRDGYIVINYVGKASAISTKQDALSIYNIATINLSGGQHIARKWDFYDFALLETKAGVKVLLKRPYVHVSLAGSRIVIKSNQGALNMYEDHNLNIPNVPAQVDVKTAAPFTKLYNKYMMAISSPSAKGQWKLYQRLVDLFMRQGLLAEALSILNMYQGKYIYDDYLKRKLVLEVYHGNWDNVRALLEAYPVLAAQQYALPWKGLEVLRQGKPTKAVRIFEDSYLEDVPPFWRGWLIEQYMTAYSYLGKWERYGQYAWSTELASSMTDDTIRLKMLRALYFQYDKQYDKAQQIYEEIQNEEASGFEMFQAYKMMIDMHYANGQIDLDEVIKEYMYYEVFWKNSHFQSIYQLEVIKLLWRKKSYEELWKRIDKLINDIESLSISLPTHSLYMHHVTLRRGQLQQEIYTNADDMVKQLKQIGRESFLHFFKSDYKTRKAHKLFEYYYDYKYFVGDSEQLEVAKKLFEWFKKRGTYTLALQLVQQDILDNLADELEVSEVKLDMADLYRKVGMWENVLRVLQDLYLEKDTQRARSLHLRVEAMLNIDDHALMGLILLGWDDSPVAVKLKAGLYWQDEQWDILLNLLSKHDLPLWRYRRVLAMLRSGHIESARQYYLEHKKQVDEQAGNSLLGKMFEGNLTRLDISDAMLELNNLS